MSVGMAMFISRSVFAKDLIPSRHFGDWLDQRAFPRICEEPPDLDLKKMSISMIAGLIPDFAGGFVPETVKRRDGLLFGQG